MSVGRESSLQHDSLDVWTLTQYLTESDGFPFLLQAVDVQVCLDFAGSHHKCCWTRSMLQPLWETLLASQVTVKNTKNNIDSPSPLSLEEGSSASLFTTRQTLREISNSIQLLHGRQQQQQRTSSRGVERLRYIHSHPLVMCMGKGLTGTFTVTFSLQRCSTSGLASSALFPSFLAIEPDGVTSPFIIISVSEVRRRPSTQNLALLILQSISSDGNVATYSALDMELHFTSLSSTAPCSFVWGFRVYAAFYSSAEEQVRLDEPFIHLHDWAPRVKQQERFAVTNTNMDPHVILSSEKNHRASIDRRIKSAIGNMDAAAEVGGSGQSCRAALCHIATLQTSRCISVEPCTQPGNGTLAAVMRGNILWPLQLQAVDATGRTWCTAPITGSSSLERLAREIGRLEELLSGGEEKQKEV